MTNSPQPIKAIHSRMEAISEQQSIMIVVFFKERRNEFPFMFLHPHIYNMHPGGFNSSTKLFKIDANSPASLRPPRIITKYVSVKISDSDLFALVTCSL